MPAAAQDDYKTALRRYKTWLRRPSLRKRMDARERLAETGDMRAFKVLTASYARTEQPREQVRYLIANLVTENFADAEHLPLYEAWRARHAASRDAWLWYKTLLLHEGGKGPDDLVAIARGGGNVFLRAAALEALRMTTDEPLFRIIPELAGKLPIDPVPRAVMLESLTAALGRFSDRRAAPEFRAPAEAIIARMDEAATLERTRIVMGRYMSRLFRVPFMYRSGKRWKLELDFAQHGGKQASMDGYGKKKPPTFAGLEVTGDRVCYLIDMSDSMLTPLTHEELDKLPRGPATGPARGSKKSKNDAWTKAFENVKWDLVRTRFDAARELLKVSLLSLDEDRHVFSVIWFGDEAGMLKSTRGLVKPTAAKVKAVFRELNAIRGGPAKANTAGRLGSLRGDTNIHGALHRAFKLRAKGLVGPGEYVNPATWTKGCDTIFLLTDGDPTADDWIEWDKRDPGDRVGDPETGASMSGSDSDRLHFRGPYARSRNLVADVRRLNLFRKAEIHCVGMGEASMGLLRRIAGLGYGKAISLRRGGK